MRPVAAILAALLMALGPASAAWAHGTEPPPATNYRTEVVSAPPGVSVRTVAAGYQLELTNRGGTPVTVLGYEGEPFLRIDPDGVFENAHSPTPYVNQTKVGPAPDPDAPVSWRKISDDPVARWHDHRATFPADGPVPSAVRAAPGVGHQLGSWAVPLRTGAGPAEITGTVTWVPPPAPGQWWAVALLLAAGVVGLARLVRITLVPASVAGGVATLGYAVAVRIDAGAANPGQVLVGLATDQVWGVLAGLAMIAAGAYFWRRPGSGTGDFALALSGACLAVFGGLVHVVVFTRGVAPVPFDPMWARVAVAVALGCGVGVAATAVLRLRAAAREPQPS